MLKSILMYLYEAQVTVKDKFYLILVNMIRFHLMEV